VPKDSVLLRFQDTEARARVEQEQANLKDAQSRLKIAAEENQRVRNLIERKLVSQSDADRLDATFNSAAANVELAKARIVQAQQQLDYTVVRAPYSGVVVTRHVQLGETVQVGQALMTGFSLDALRVVSTIPQDLVLQLRERTSARVLIDDRSVSVDSQAVTIFPYADKSSHSFKIWLGLPEKFSALYPGMLVKVAFAIGDGSRLLIPESALVQRSEVTGLYVLNNKGEPSFRRVLAGRKMDGKVEIISGLSEGEQVAVDPIAATSRVKVGNH
jgi:RND family efflux transporter MFP subunit